MRKRTLKSFQRKSKNLVSYYCTGCRAFLPVDKSLCSGCEEARKMGKQFEKFLGIIQGKNKQKEN